MARFNYTAYDVRGAEKTGLIDAVSADQAVAALKGQSLFPVEVTQAAAVAAAPPPVRQTAAASFATGPAPVSAPKRGLHREVKIPFVRPVTEKELAVFTRQIATLLRAGMPLLRGLEVLGKQEKHAAFKRIITALADEIRSGGTLSGAMAQHPKVFDRLYVNMIKAGEAGGVLDVVLERLAGFAEKSLRLRDQIKAAMMYPLIVMSVAVLILAALLVFVVPKFKQIFAELLKGAPLPALTQLVLGISDLVKQHALSTVAVLVALGLVLRYFRKTASGARLVDTCLVRLPVFGDLILKALIARFSRTLGTLLSSGVPILQALVITRDTCGNTRVASAIEFVHDRVKEGDPVAQPLESTQVFPSMVTSLIDVGEQTGQLPEMLGKVADIYDEEVDTAVKGLSSLIEPLLILLLAGVVGTIVIALFLPIIRIVQLLT